MIEPKPLFIERMKKLLPDARDFEAFNSIIHQSPRNYIRCNTLKITPNELKEKLEEKGWKIEQPFSEYPEIMLIDSELQPGELGRAREHILGYYYAQEVSSMMPIVALAPRPGEIMLDICASPGSKPTHAASCMENQGTIIANDKDLGRITILASNLERCAVSNSVITREDAVQLCIKLKKLGMKFDKILLDVPCSGEGSVRSNIKTLVMWNIKMIEKLSNLQKKLAASAVDLLKEDGEIVYSTCTLTPEENERVVSFLKEKFELEIERVNLPLKCRQGIKEWQGEKFADGIENCSRIYPQDNDCEGFFLAKMKKII